MHGSELLPLIPAEALERLNRQRDGRIGEHLRLTVKAPQCRSCGYDHAMKLYHGGHCCAWCASADWEKTRHRDRPFIITWIEGLMEMDGQTIEDWLASGPTDARRLESGLSSRAEEAAH